MTRSRLRKPNPHRRRSAAEEPTHTAAVVVAAPAEELPAPGEAPDFDEFDLEDTDPPFDPPDADDEIFRSGPPAADADEAQPATREGPAAAAAPSPRARPAPAITVHASWDDPETGALLAEVGADRRMVRTDFSITRGGLEGAISRFSTQPSPNLLLLESTLAANEILASLERLTAVVAGAAKIVLIGAINDVMLLRELARRGVQYLLTPTPEEVVDAICALYADADTSRVIAVVGARGGVGASTLALNLAWSIAERQEASATLVELDLPFGAAAFDLDHRLTQSIADGLVSPDGVDEAFLDRVAIKRTQRLSVLPAPATLEREFELEARHVEAVIDRVRRTSSFVVLDVPHRWTGWVKAALLYADEVLIVATPDLASMRNAKGLLDVLRAGRPRDREPLLALSMVGAPKRPEISAKEFADAAGATPVASLAFDPELVGQAAIRGRAIGETAPRSPMAGEIDALASLLSGRQPAPARRSKAPAAAEAPPLAVARPAPETAGGPPPFTFKPAQHQGEPDEAPLVLGRDAAVEHVRHAARAELRSARPPTRRRGRPGTIRAAMLLAALILGALWFMQSRREANAAVAPPAPSVQVAEAPAPRLDEANRLYQSARAMLQAGQTQDGVAALTRAAEAGLPGAQYRLAKLYESGAGVQPSLRTARQWTERAADGGNSRAMHDLGVYFARGDGGPQDDVTAAHWFRQAADFGVADSQYNLGVLYQEGRGVDRNPSEALFWFMLAAAQGDHEALARMAAVEQDLSPTQIGAAEDRAKHFQTKAPIAGANDAS